jgi:hypothetical protein
MLQWLILLDEKQIGWRKLEMVEEKERRGRDMI